MAGLDFLFSPNSQYYNARQNMIKDNLTNRGLDLQNMTTEAALPGVQGRSQSLAVQGQLDQAGLPMKMKLQEAEGLQKMDDAQLKQLGGVGEKYSQIGGYLESVPAPLRGAEYQRMIQQYGFPSIPGIENVSPDELPSVLSKTGEKMTLMSSDSIKKREQLRMQEEAAANRAKVAGEYGVKAAQVRADATLEKTNLDNQARAERLVQELDAKAKQAEQRAQIAEQRLNIEQQISTLRMRPDFETNPDVQKKFRDLSRMKIAFENAKVNQLNSEVMGGQTPTTGPQRAGGVVDDIAPLPNRNPIPVQEQGPSPEIAVKLKEMGQEYDPSYVYRINPQTGKVERARKPI